MGTTVGREPIFRWAGSKRRLLSKLLACVPETINCYYEPFAGSACLFLALNPQRAVIGDLNSDLIETYRAIREHPRLVAQTVHAMPPTKRHYYALRKRSTGALSSVE